MYIHTVHMKVICHCTFLDW